MRKVVAVLIFSVLATLATAQAPSAQRVKLMVDTVKPIVHTKAGEMFFVYTVHLNLTPAISFDIACGGEHAYCRQLMVGYAYFTAVLAKDDQDAYTDYPSLRVTGITESMVFFGGFDYDKLSSRTSRVR